MQVLSFFIFCKYIEKITQELLKKLNKEKRYLYMYSMREKLVKKNLYKSLYKLFSSNDFFNFYLKVEIGKKVKMVGNEGGEPSTF